MLSLQPGHDVAYLTGPVAGGRESYYTGAVAAGEPPGIWYGAGAEALGLSGDVDADVMEAVYSHHIDPRDPNAAARATWGQAEQFARGHHNYKSPEQMYKALLEANPGAGPERRAELQAQAEGSNRQAVSFIDATVSAQKSVTVLAVAFERAANEARAAGDIEAAAAWTAHHKAVEDALLAGGRAAIEFLQDEAGYSRVGHHGGGAGRWIDAHEFVVAGFVQHDSRDRDPNLHLHQAILNRARCADGTWRTLDSRAIHRLRGAAGAVAERVMEAHLARSLGLRFETRPDGRAREIVGVPQDVMDMFSSRRRAVTAKADELLTAYRQRHGREPSALERTQISQRATLITRQAKSHDGETLEQRLDRWETETRTQLAGGLSRVAQMVLDRAQQSDPAVTWSQRDVIERALASLAESRQSWSRSDLTRALSDALPGHLDVDPGDVRELLSALTDTALDYAVQVSHAEDTEGLTDDLLREDGRSVYERPGGARYSTPGQLAAERVLREAAVERGAHTLNDDQAAAVIARLAENGRELGADQAAAVRGILTSGAKVETLSAAAGSGKSFVVAALADGWTHGRVVGLAPSQIAAQVLADEGVTAANVTRWLGAQTRLDRPGQHAAEDEAMRLREGDLLVLDEAGMCSTADIHAVQQRCHAVGAKLLLTGDPRQLAAVGPGGALADVAEHGLRYNLTEVRRFSAAWEGAASLQVRDRDPAGLDAYERHGRLRDGGTADQAEAAAGRAWLADTLAGHDTLLLVGSNDAAARVSAALRAELVDLGLVAEHGVPLALGTVAGVGDRVQGRHNAWDLIGHDGNTQAPINRAEYQVTAVSQDGGLQVVDKAGVALSLPAAYVEQHLDLAYAATVHSSQGRTVDRCHSVLGSRSDAGAAYVALTRGRDSNVAWAITRAVGDDAPTGSTLDTQARTPRAVLADVLNADTSDTDRTAAGQVEDAAHDAVSAQRHLDRLAAEVTEATAGRVDRILDQLTLDGALSAGHRTALAADPAVDGLGRLLRSAELAGHDPEQVLRDAVTERGLDGARSPAQVVHHRISTSLRDQLAPRLDTYRDLIPASGLTDDQRARLERLADAADHRRTVLGSDTAAKAPQWALEALGPVPSEPVARNEWEYRAGYAATYRELAGHDDNADPLGAAPPAGLGVNHAVWRTAHDQLGLLDSGADEAELSDGQLRVRVRAMERENNWAPPWVGDRLSAAEQAAEHHRADAELWRAHAETTDAPETAQRLREDAGAAQARADGFAMEAQALDAADTARSRWYLHTIRTRELGERSRTELGARGVDLDDPDDRVTADEWLAAHREDQAQDDQHREITEDDVREDHEPLEIQDGDAAETAVPDVRETYEPAENIDSTAELIARAQASLAEISARETEQAHVAEIERQDQITRWVEQDRAEEAETAHDGPALDR